jgi:hypothetical protein
MQACLALSAATAPRTPTAARLKITFGEMRELGLRGVLIYCHCGRNIALSADRWPHDARCSLV